MKVLIKYFWIVFLVTQQAAIVNASSNAFDTRSFNLLKKALHPNGDSKPFYVIVVSRSSYKRWGVSMNELDKLLLASLLNKITNDEDVDVKESFRQELDDVIRNFGGRTVKQCESPFVKYLVADVALASVGKDYTTVLQKYLSDYYQAVEKVVQNPIYHAIAGNPGIITFNEGFFQGSLSNGRGRTYVLPNQLADRVSIMLSRISKNMILACNNTALAHEVFPQQLIDEAHSEFVRSMSTNKVNCSRPPLKHTPNKYGYANAIFNATKFWHNGDHLATYTKQTYIRENDDLITQGLAWYIFGDGNIHTRLRDHKLTDAFCQNFDIQICKDYSYQEGRTRFVNFRIVQSNSILTNQAMLDVFEKISEKGIGIAQAINAELNSMKSNAKDHNCHYIIYNDSGIAYKKKWSGVTKNSADCPDFPTMFRWSEENENFLPVKPMFSIKFTAGLPDKLSEYRIDVHKLEQNRLS